MTNSNIQNQLTDQYLEELCQRLTWESNIQAVANSIATLELDRKLQEVA